MATFDELADRLKHASDPAERIAAAEELAGLPDPGVAPALARALADPDPRVRARVEELLRQFCRQDRSGHLERLLDEAERVAEALAREVDRLRGPGGAEAPPAPSEPIEPSEGFEGPCALVRLAPEEDDVKRACTLVAARLGQALFLVTREVQTTKGFFARGVPAPLARTIVRELHAAGTVAGAVPVEAVPTPPQPLRLREASFGPDALRGTLLPSGQACELPWESVELAVAARLEVELKRQGSKQDWSYFTPPLQGADATTHETGHDYLLEVLGGEPVQRLRLGTHQLDFDAMQRRPSSFGRVARLAARLARRMDRRRLNAGIRRLEEQDDERWDDLTFVSPVGYESYVAWQRLLLRLDVPLPR